MRDNNSNPDLPPLEHHTILEKFLHNSAAAAVILLTMAVAAFVVANSPAGHWYEELLHKHLGLIIGAFEFEMTTHHFINDALMAIFFFLVGLEIKRELLVGELASLRKAMLPIAAAIGGMVAPALIYTAINWGTGDPEMPVGSPTAGWGIPMATDIAFAAGVIGLLSKRVPHSLAVFLIALAIVDDLGSVLVIAVFYTAELNTQVLIIGLGLVGFSFVLARFGVRNMSLFAFLAILIWLAFLKSGVHATVAGVLFAFTIPASARYGTPHFVGRIKHLLTRFNEADGNDGLRQVNAKQQHIIRSIEAECVHVEAPLQRLELKLHPYSAFLIMPIFAFANAGVHVPFDEIWSLLFSRVTLGVICGLVLGKQIGIMAACWIAVKLGWAELPRGVSWKLVWGLTWLAGIGFTMSLFIGQLAFPVGGHGAEALEPEHAEAVARHLAESKVGTLLASVIAGVGGILILLSVTKPGQGGDDSQDASSH